MIKFNGFNRSLERYVVYLLVFAIPILLLANIFLIYQNSKVIEYNKQLQEDAESIKVNTLNIIRTIHQLDMGLRGYALINSKLQRKVTTNGFPIMEKALDQLEVSLGAQGFPMQSFYTMKDSVNIYLDTVIVMIELIDEGKMLKFNKLLTEDLGYYAFLAYARFEERVNSFEDKIAEEARRNYNLALRNSYLLQIVIFLIAVPAIFYTVYLFNKTLKVSENLRVAEQDNNNILASQKVKLKRQVQERTNEILAQNEEISAQNEEITSHNEQLVLQQDEIAIQRNILAEKNKKLEEAYTTIEQQHSLIQEKNEKLRTEVKLQTKDLRKTNHELIEQNNRLEQFAYIISHNLRAPMARLIGLATILKHARTNEEKSNIIGLMVKSTSEFDHVIKDLALIVSIQKLNTDVYSLIHLDTMLQKMLEMLKPEISSTCTEINVDFTNAPSLYSLPQYAESILYNLISNGIKYRHPDRTPFIRVKSRKVNNFTQITVSDNGLGIDLDKHKEALFSLYKRFHFHVEGKGLGLYLVRTQVEALGGRIKIESKVGTGSTFKLEFKNYENTIAQN